MFSRLANKKGDADSSQSSDLITALDSVQAIIWFDPQGNILKANENFLATVGYSIDELIGSHHPRWQVSAGQQSRRNPLAGGLLQPAFRCKR